MVEVVRFADPHVAVARADPELEVETLVDAALDVGAAVRVACGQGEADEVLIRYTGGREFVRVR